MRSNSCQGKKKDDMPAVLKRASLGCLLQLWCHAIALLAEVILDGVSRIKGRCSAIGRNAMITDLQVQKSLHLHRHTEV